MSCLDPAEVPFIQPLEAATFEDVDVAFNGTDASEMQMCGFHPKATVSASTEELELAWERCSRVYYMILFAAIAAVIIWHFGFLLCALWRAARRACLRQTHLRTPCADTVERNEVPLTNTADYVWYVEKGKEPLKGLTQEDFIDFEHYAHFIYAHSHEN